MADTADLAVGFQAGDGILGLSADTHADWTAAFGQVGPWTCIAASAAGHVHLREGTPRDDAFAIRSAGPWLAVAVADGAGSRPSSRYGASFAVASLCEQMLRAARGLGTSPGGAESETGTQPDTTAEPDPAEPAHAQPRRWLPWLRAAKRTADPEAGVVRFPDPPSAEPRGEAQQGWGTLAWRRERALLGEGTQTPDLAECVRTAFRATRAGLDAYAAQRSIAIRDLHCTLLGVLLDTRTGAMGVGQIGDGLISCLHPGMGAKPLAEPPSTGNVGETYVLTQSDWERFLAVRALAPEETAGIRTVYVMTDGVAEDCTHPPPEGIFDRWSRDIDREMRAPSSPSAACVKLARWLATYEAPASWDDRTLAVLLLQDTVEATPPGAGGSDARE
jgi:hypothetical protein